MRLIAAHRRTVGRCTSDCTHETFLRIQLTATLPLIPFTLAVNRSGVPNDLHRRASAGFGFQCSCGFARGPVGWMQHFGRFGQSTNERDAGPGEC